VGRKDRRKGSRGRAESRVRGRVRDRTQDRARGRTRRGEEGTGRRRVTFDVGDVAGYAERLKGDVGGASGVAAAASAIGGAASGIAGRNLVHGLSGSDAGDSEEDFRREVRERLDLIEERLGRLEDEMGTPSGEGDPGEQRSVPDPGH
jgi:hypothetical protein